VPTRVSLLEKLLRPHYVRAGDFFDRWYEELPWRKRIPLGIRGEQIATRYLRRSGYLILARNYRAAHAEIDLVAADHGTLVFVEVKARTGTAFGMPAEAVDERKQKRIRRAAQVYIARRRRVRAVPVRFDVVGILGAGRNRRLDLIKGAF
jgi:putative endonuclease